MGMWTIPTIIASALIVAVSYYLTAGVMKKAKHQSTASDSPISKVIRDHPVAANPIIIMYLIFGLFTGIIIFYYWAKTGY
ncbi:short-chain dehydrogenase [Lysinibacillus yapensis]|uniref:Short-chain dehydrogenase n=1 Tax=Ureibacillus yapensis TaxID=2304605 RepID=A0A396SEW4_9BACL|nr:short-chain dehydrogenase [Lysinibacillus yapensis]RHW39815.1 short-chain dehydrogenase [Lysinibacillus yapensis]